MVVNASLGICPTTKLLRCMPQRTRICLVSPGSISARASHPMRIVRGKTSRKITRLGRLLNIWGPFLSLFRFENGGVVVPRRFQGFRYNSTATLSSWCFFPVLGICVPFISLKVLYRGFLSTFSITFSNSEDSGGRGLVFRIF